MMITIVIVSLIGAGAFFVAGQLAGIRRERQRQSASNAADRLRADFRDEQRQARQQLEKRLDDLYGKLEAIQQSLPPAQQDDAKVHSTPTGDGELPERPQADPRSQREVDR